MPTPIRPLFRTDALQRYAQRQDRITLPRLLAPARLFQLWVFLGLLLVGGVVVGWLIAGRI